MKIQIISSSVREGRKSHYAALFIEQWIQENTKHEASILDLKALDFPLFPERLKFMKNPDSKLVEFAQAIDSADGIFIVAPEYNGSIPASLKNVVDVLNDEWQNKPISLVPIGGGIFAGTQVTKDLAFLMYRLGSLVTKTRMHVGKVHEVFNEQGELLQNQEFYHKVMGNCIAELERFATLNQS